MKTLNELDTLASNLLQKLPELMQAGTVYANELTHRFVIYSLVKASITATVCSIVIVSYIILTVKWFKWCIKKESNSNMYTRGDYYVGWVLGNFALFVLLLPALNGLTQSFETIMQALYLPELLILNYFK